MDRFIQRYRIGQTKPFIQKSSRVLDIGCADGALFRCLPYLQDGVGIDPDVDGRTSLPNAKLFRGFFPDALPDNGPFDVITLLAVLEHLPSEAQVALARNCFMHLAPGGLMIITVPSPAVDKILDVLIALKLVDGMHTEEHYGFDVTQTPALFESAGFRVRRQKKFQLGLNNLFVFEKPVA
ncbi:MAG TPA: class I SAM-dependent methyltransferase [Terracidiphilus sp.]